MRPPPSRCVSRPERFAHWPRGRCSGRSLNFPHMPGGNAAPRSATGPMALIRSSRALLHESREPEQHLCSDRHSIRDRSRRAACRFPSDSSLRCVHSTAHKEVARSASCRSPKCISCGAPQGEAEHGVGRIEDMARLHRALGMLRLHWCRQYATKTAP
jgi:hypothetical protein